MQSLSTPPQILALAQAGAFFCFSVSGGKDGNVAAIAGNAFLDSLGHPRERRLLIHAHLGDIEWEDSLQICRELAVRLGLPLHEVQNPNHDMVGCWRRRWDLSLARYARLEVITLVAPWSSAELRFCTDRQKTVPITRKLVALAGRDAAIVSVIGIRGDESRRRARQPVYAADANLDRPSRSLEGHVWRPIHAWTVEEVWDAHRESGFRRHEAYELFGSTRVSCSFCVMSSMGDLQAAVRHPGNVKAYRRVVDLEVESAFSFQSGRWLGDTCPQALEPGVSECLQAAKRTRAVRQAAEATVPRDLLYEKGWPTFVPTLAQCGRLAEVRATVCGLHRINSPYLTAESIRARYIELLALKATKESGKKAKARPVEA